MEIKPKLLFSKVSHQRLFPKVNGFTYDMYYLAFPLSKINELKITKNKFGLLSFYEKDHGYKDGTSIAKWIENLLSENNILVNGEVVLVTLPRILGYVFNPVSFYFCLDGEQNLKAVVCEVNNTFGESHTYICAKGDEKNIYGDDWLEAEKIFHVSPFLNREGKYKFRFDYQKDKLGVWIDFYDKNNEKQLTTSISGKFEEFNKKNLNKAFWQYPLITFKTIFLIHWQAIKLVWKKIKYVPKPKQLDKRVSTTNNLTKI